MSRSPRRAALALVAGLAIAAALVCLPVTAASTASVEVPSTIVGLSEMHVVGGVLVAINHTIINAGDTPSIIETMVTLRGKLLQLWIHVRVGAGESMRCLRHGWISPPGQGDPVTQFRCTALNQPAPNAAVWVDARSR